MGWKREPGTPLQSSSRDRREHSAEAAHRTHVPHFVEKWEEKKDGADNKASSSSTCDHRDRTSAVSPSEHEQKSPAFIQKLAACVEDGAHWITVLQTSLRVKGNGKERTAECPAVHYMKRSWVVHMGCTTSERWKPQGNWVDGNVPYNQRHKEMEQLVLLCWNVGLGVVWIFIYLFSGITAYHKSINPQKEDTESSTQQPLFHISEITLLSIAPPKGWFWNVGGKCYYVQMLILGARGQ